MIKVKIAREKCAGHGRCAAVAPQIYELDDDGYIATDRIEAPDALRAEAQRGLRACPERIISIEDVVTQDPAATAAVQSASSTERQ